VCLLLLKGKEAMATEVKAIGTKRSKVAWRGMVGGREIAVMEVGSRKQERSLGVVSA
jgi:hypothetical protein